MGNILINSETTFPATSLSSDSGESDEDDNITFSDDHVVDHEETDKGEEKSATLYTNMSPCVEVLSMKTAKPH